MSRLRRTLPGRTDFGENSSLPSRVLGKTGVRLPILGFGTAAAGKRLSQQDAVALYEEALQAGVRYFDTAPEFAGYGKAQEQLGHLLRRHRSEVFLVTKCFEATGEGALRLLDRSLRELQTDYADLVFVHSVGDDTMDPRMVFSTRGCYAALMRAKAQGLTRFVGLSGHNRPRRFQEAVQRFEVDVLLNAVNFADRHIYNFEDQVWPAARARQIGLIAMKVFGGARDRSPSALSHCMVPTTYLDAAFRYALSLPSVGCAVIGMATRRELHENVRRARAFVPLGPSEERQLASAGRQLAREWKDHFGAVDG